MISKLRVKKASRSSKGNLQAGGKGGTRERGKMTLRVGLGLVSGNGIEREERKGEKVRLSELESESRRLHRGGYFSHRLVSLSSPCLGDTEGPNEEVLEEQEK